jgi:hypothetical protein
VPSVESFKERPIEWLIDGLVAMGTTNIITGPAGGGKSYLALGMAGQISTGKPFCGLGVTQCPVAIIDRETPDRSLALLRLRQMGITTGPDLVWFGNWNYPHEPPLPTSSSIDQWLQEVLPRRAVIIFDSQIENLDGADENSSVDMRRFYRPFRGYGTKYGATTFLLHHVGKADGSEFRGSSDIPAAVDALYAAISTGKDPTRLERLTLKYIKGRYPSKHRALHLRFDDSGSGWRLDSEAKPDHDRKSTGLIALLKEHPGITLAAFGELATKKKIAGRDPAISFLKEGVKDGQISQTTGRNNSRMHTWREDAK